jgi:hypothetical protein
MTMADAMLLIAGVAVGLWLSRGDNELGLSFAEWDSAVFVTTSYILGGLSLIGPPYLLVTARRKPWGEGRFLWLVLGTAVWLTWPGVALRSYGNLSGHHREACNALFMITAPLIALCHLVGLLASGQLRRARRRLGQRSWQERFGLVLGLAWNCIGVYLLALVYWDEFLH